MEFLRRIIGQIKTHLGQLTISQKLVFVLCIIVMGGAIWHMARYASERETVPLLNQDFSEADLNRIVNKLDGWDERYQIKGGKVLVEKSRQRQLIARLAYAEMLPRDTSMGWSSLLENSDIWTPESVRENRKLIVMQMELARAIEDGWPEVEKAEVFINKGSQRTLSNVQPVASASVMIKLTPGASAPGRLAESIAAFVSSANNQMKRENVRVIVDGKLVAVVPEGEQISGDYIAMKTQYEQHFRDKIINALPISNSLVEVDVTLETTSTVKHETLYTPEGEGSWNAPVEESGQEENTENAQQQAEPGLIANAMEKPAPAGGTNQKSTTERTARSNRPFAGSKNTSMETPRGGIREITAAIMIPSSYFEAVAQQGAKEGEKPGVEQVEAVKKVEIPKIKQVVMRIIGKVKPEDESKVVVEGYWAAGIAAAHVEPGEKGGAAIQADVSSMGGLVQRYGKHVAVSALAMISLFMVLMMVRKAGQPMEIKNDKETAMTGQSPVEALSFEDSNIASGHEDGLLAGLELGEETMRSQQVLGQIRQMVSDDPDAAATLLSRWMQED
jgi:flagellar biosynthesis/type III secretory pathway M-ring protein FliF/YscJ